MTTAIVRQLLAVSLALAGTFLISIGVRAQVPTPTANWVNIKSPRFGAIGDGRHDDTAAIQAAIDYAYNNNIFTVYCPAGNYLTSSTIYLDPPGNMRPFTFQGYIRGTTLTVTTPPSGVSKLFVYGSYGTALSGSGIAPGTQVTGGGGTSWTVNISQTVGNTGSPIVFIGSNYTNPPFSNFRMSFIGDPGTTYTSGPQANQGGCNILPESSSFVAFMSGPGQNMRVQDVAITGPSGGYRFTQSNVSGGVQQSVGLGIAGGPGGAHITVIKNVSAADFYYGFVTDANNGCCLADSNTFDDISAYNTYAGVYLYGTEAFIDHIIDPVISSSTIGVYDPDSHQAEIVGGNISAYASGDESGSASWSGITAPATLTIDATLPGTGWVPGIYAFSVLTPDYGVIPLSLASWNSSTNAAVFNIDSGWAEENYGNASLVPNNLYSEIAATTSLYYTERVYITDGSGVTLTGTHIENEACTALYSGGIVWSGQGSNEFKNVFFDYDISNPVGNTASAIAIGYCQRLWPIVSESTAGAGSSTVVLDGGNWAEATEPLLIEDSPWNPVVGRNLGSAHFNIWVPDSQFRAYGNTAQANGSSWPLLNQWETVAHGSGYWDNDYFGPINTSFGLYTTSAGVISAGGPTDYGQNLWNTEALSQFCGFEPCPWAMPNLSPTLYQSVGGTLGALGTYPLIDCRTVYKSVGWNSGAQANGYSALRSASCPGYSYGQNINATTTGTTTDAVVTGTVLGNTLTVSAVTSGSLAPGDQITGPNIASNVYILQGNGGTGTYTLNTSRACTSTCSGETITAPAVTWYYYSGSDVLYLDSTAMKWMFPGLGISLNNGWGLQPYAVTGIYPDLGYVTVIYAGAPAGGQLQTPYPPNGNVAFGCASGCSIVEAPYEFTDPPRWVQGQAGFAMTATSHSVALPNTIGNNHCVVGGVQLDSTSVTVTGITDDKGNIYSVINTQAGNGATVETFDKCGITNSPRTITASFSASVNSAIAIDEFAGVAGVDVHSINAQASAPTSANGITSSAATTTHNGDFIWGVGFASYYTAAPSAGTGFTAEQQRYYAGTNIGYAVLEQQQQSSAGPIAATFTDSHGLNWITAMVALH